MGHAFQFFTSVREPAGTVFVAGLAGDGTKVAFARILPDRRAQDDGVLEVGSRALGALGRFGASTDGQVWWLWGEVVDAQADRILERRFDPAAGSWDATKTVAEGPEVSSAFDLNVSASGQAMLVWDKGTDVWALERAGSGWGSPVQLDPPDMPPDVKHYAHGAVFAGTAGGRGLAAWDEDGQLKAALYDPGRGWEPATTPDVDFGAIDRRSVAIDDAGRGAIVWVSGGTDLHATLLEGGAWSGDQLIGTGSDLGIVEVVILGGGQVLVLVSDSQGSEQALVLYAFESGQWKGYPVTASAGGAGIALAATPDGKAVVVYAEFSSEQVFTGPYVVKSARYDPAGGLAAPVDLAPPWIDPPNHIDLHVGGDGTVQALWSETSLTAAETSVYLEVVP